MSVSSTLVSALAAAVAVALALPRRPGPAARPPRTRWTLPAGMLALVPLWVVAPVPARFVVPTLVLGGAGLGLLRLRRLRARRLAAERTGDQVREACDLLAAELGAGRPTTACLAAVATTCPVLAPVAEAARLGADVPTALRERAQEPGAADLRLLAGAWQVTHRSGHGLATAVALISTSLRRSAASQRVVASELASARATARLVALLPLPALAMGSGAGGDPWGFLLATPAGWACLAAGLGLGLAGLTWIEAITAEAAR